MLSYNSFFFFYLCFTVCQDYLTHFEPTQSLEGVKIGDPLNKHLTTRKQNLAECLTYDSSQAQTHSNDMTINLKQ